MCGSHTLKTWSSTQKSVTLSSGEAELVAVVKMSCELIGLTQMLGEWGINKHGRVWVDSSAALGIVKRKGNGKMRHVRVGQLWVQEASDRGDLSYSKVLGTENPSDLMTKYLSGKDTWRHMSKLQQVQAEGKAEKGLDLV